MDVYNSIFESNFHKINQNCGNFPETFWVEKHNNVKISTDYPLLWKSIRNFHIFSWVEIFLRIFWQPFLLGIFPQNFLLCGNLFLIFQEKIIKIFHNFSRVDLFHKIVVANHAMLRKFQTPQNLSEEGFQLFSCLSYSALRVFA